MSNESKQESWWHTMPGMISAIAAVLTAITGLILALRDNAPSAPAPVQPAPAAVAAAPAAPVSTARPRATPPTLQLSGLWRDNWGTVYRVTMQNAGRFTYEAQGVACHGGNFRSVGEGDVSGSAVRSVYQSSLPSQGSCSGSLDAGGRTMTVTCNDSACGTFVATSTLMQ